MSSYSLLSPTWECGYLSRQREDRLFWAVSRVADRAKGNLLVCGAMGEEGKASFAVVSELCRAAWRTGWSVGRFDYAGTGDSEGDFSQTRPADWIADAEAAKEALASAALSVRRVIFGVRLGANIAFQLARRLARAGYGSAGLILWEPILDFAAFGRRMRWLNRLTSDETGIDAFGWFYPRACMEQLEPALAIGTPAELVTLGVPVFIGLTGGNAKAMKWTRKSSVNGSLFPLEIVTVRTQPFWELIGQTEATELIERTVQWLNHLHVIDADP